MLGLGHHNQVGRHTQRGVAVVLGSVHLLAAQMRHSQVGQVVESEACEASLEMPQLVEEQVQELHFQLEDQKVEVQVVEEELS